MTIYARQFSPEAQQSPLMLDGYDLIDCIIYGNPDYHTHGLDLLDELPDDVRDELGCRPDPDALAAALTEHTGHTWDSGAITGCCQREWQYLVYRVDFWPYDARKALEMEYFNTGTEWLVYTDITDEVSVYCYGYTSEQIAEEIKNAFGGSPADTVQLDWFDGYNRTPKYRRETV